MTLNDLNGIMVIILRYLAEFGIAFVANYKKWLISHQQISPEKCYKVHQLSTADVLCSRGSGASCYN